MELFKKREYPALRQELFGMDFPHPIGASRGLDPNGERYNHLRFASFVEIGPLSPVDDSQNTVKSLIRRIFGRDDHKQGSVKLAIENIQKKHPKTLIMANLASSQKYLDGQSVTKDLVDSFSRLYDFVDMFVIDSFRENKDGIISLQNVEYISEAVDELLDIRSCYEVSKPLFIRVSATIARPNLESLLDYMMYSGVDGIIAGCDAYPLELVRTISSITKGRYPIIACGSADTAEKAMELMNAGANLVQVKKHFRKTVKYLSKNTK